MSIVGVVERVDPQFYGDAESTGTYVIAIEVDEVDLRRFVEREGLPALPYGPLLVNVGDKVEISVVLPGDLSRRESRLLGWLWGRLRYPRRYVTA